MNADYVLLTEKEAMWAEMLVQVLKDNQIPYVTQPVYGAGFAIKTGAQERLKVYVPKEKESEARRLYDELFTSEWVSDHQTTDYK